MRYSLLFAASSLAIALSTPSFAQETAMASATAASETTAEQNPLLAAWTGPFEGVPPWDQMAPGHFAGAYEAAMAEYRAEVQAIIDNPEAPTFANTNAAMELTGDLMNNVEAMFGVATSNVSNDEYRAVEAEWAPRTAALPESIFAAGTDCPLSCRL